MVYTRTRENCVDSGNLISINPIKMCVSRKIFKDKHSLVGKIEPLNTNETNNKRSFPSFLPIEDSQPSQSSLKNSAFNVNPSLNNNNEIQKSNQINLMNNSNNNATKAYLNQSPTMEIKNQIIMNL